MSTCQQGADLDEAISKVLLHMVPILPVHTCVMNTETIAE